MCLLKKHGKYYKDTVKGSENVRRTKLRMLTSKFESLRMEETESITDYDRRLRELANEAF